MYCTFLVYVLHEHMQLISATFAELRVKIVNVHFRFILSLL
jgi:hypothetical protein